MTTILGGRVVFFSPAPAAGDSNSRPSGAKAQARSERRRQMRGIMRRLPLVKSLPAPNHARGLGAGRGVDYACPPVLSAALFCGGTRMRWLLTLALSLACFTAPAVAS